MYKSDCIEVEDTEDLCKNHFRKRVWDYLQKNKLAQFPLPVYNRIPNYIGSHESGQKVSALPEFHSAQTIKVNPDKPQEEVRFLTLQARKRLLVPTPRLISGLFNLLEHEDNDDQTTLRVKSQSEGIKKFSKPIGMDDAVTIDLIVLGSVAVSRTGRRIGKGEGFADIEYAMMKTMGAVNDNVKIVTAVHDCQLFDDLPSRVFHEHDVPIDIIVTPTQVFHVTHSLPKPKGIYWNLLPIEKFLQIPVLRILHQRELEKGITVKLADEVVIPTQEEVDRYQEAPRGRGGRTFRRGGRSSYRRGIGERSNRTEEGNEESEEGFRDRRTRGRGRGRGRRFYGQRSAGQEQDAEDVSNIQVTINVNKQNKIVRRKVESTDQRDRVGDADINGEDSHEGNRRPKRQNTPPTFSIFIGGIPRYCRPFELKSELAKRGVRPTYITWRGSFGFAFLNFCIEKSEEEGILTLLKDFTVKNREVTVDKAKGRAAGEQGQQDDHAISNGRPANGEESFADEKSGEEYQDSVEVVEVTSPATEETVSPKEAKVPATETTVSPKETKAPATETTVSPEETKTPVEQSNE